MLTAGDAEKEKIAALRGFVESANEAIRLLTRVDAASVVTDDGDTVPLVASQVDGYRAQAEEKLKDVPLPTKEADPIEVLPDVEAK